MRVRDVCACMCECVYICAHVHARGPEVDVQHLPLSLPALYLEAGPLPEY